ncbi:MAG: hypothetical protein MRZ66_03540 [Clostridiales bacterium]|nr:hypothetical protein [Clostridiales bacterium]
MKFGRVCKDISVVLFILDFIGSIILGNTFAIQGKHSFSDPSFNWAIFLYGVIAGFIFCLLIYALGEIIEQLECSNSNTYELYQLLKKIAPEEENKTETKKSYLTSSAPTVEKTADGGWICKKCNTKNDGNAQFCKGCGTYK